MEPSFVVGGYDDTCNMNMRPFNITITTRPGNKCTNFGPGRFGERLSLLRILDGDRVKLTLRRRKSEKRKSKTEKPSLLGLNIKWQEIWKKCRNIL